MESVFGVVEHQSEGHSAAGSEIDLTVVVIDRETVGFAHRLKVLAERLLVHRGLDRQTILSDIGCSFLRQSQTAFIGAALERCRVALHHCIGNQAFVFLVIYHFSVYRHKLVEQLLAAVADLGGIPGEKHGSVK